MAILNDLLVHGTTRCLNKAWFSDIDISGDAAVTGSISVNNRSNINGGLNVGYTNTSYALSAQTMIVNSWIRTTGSTGWYNESHGGGWWMTDNYYIRNYSKAVMLSMPLYMGTDTTYYFDQSGKINANTINASTGNISNIMSSSIYTTNANVLNTLRATKFDLQVAQTIDGLLYVCPTLRSVSPASVTVTRNSSNVVTIVLEDSSITKAEIAGITWGTGALVKISGTINGVVTGTMNATLTAINTSSHTITLSGVTGGNVDSIPAGNSTGTGSGSSGSSNVAVMVYQTGTNAGSHPVGIMINCYDQRNSSATIRVYGGTSDTPNAMLGNLNNASLPTIGGHTPANWGLYTDNGFFNGTVVSTSGNIGGLTLSNNSMNSGTWGASGSVMVCTGSQTSKSIGGSSSINGWAFTAGENYGVTNTGVVYASDVHIEGEITATSGQIGKFSITNTYLYTGSGSTTAGLGGNQAFFAGSNDSNSAPFRVGYDGTLVATKATITGGITATSLTINNNTSISGDGASQILNSNIEIGGKNLARNTGQRSPDEITQVEWIGFMLGDLPITTNEVLTVSFDLKMTIGTEINNGSPFLMVYNTNRKGKHARWIEVTNNNSNPIFIPVGNYPVGTIIEKRCSCTITTPNSFDQGTQTSDWIEFYSGYDTENAITITNIKVEKGNKATDWSPAPEDLDVHQYITDIDSGGIFISPVNVNPTTSVQGNSVKIDGTGMEIYKNSSKIAEFKSYINLGTNNTNIVNDVNLSGTTTIGTGLIANKNNQVVLGRYNKANEKSLFIIGAGLSTSDRVNAFSIDNIYNTVQSEIFSCDEDTVDFVLTNYANDQEDIIVQDLYGTELTTMLSKDIDGVVTLLIKSPPSGHLIEYSYTYNTTEKQKGSFIGSGSDKSIVLPETNVNSSEAVDKTEPITLTIPTDYTLSATTTGVRSIMLTTALSEEHSLKITYTTLSNDSYVNLSTINTVNGSKAISQGTAVATGYASHALGHEVISSGTGSIACGSGYGSHVVLEAAGVGAIAHGLILTNYGEMTASGNGALVCGVVSGGKMIASGYGSSVQGYLTNNGIMTASGGGSSVQGYVVSGTMTASSYGSSVRGYVYEGTMKASSPASSVQGYIKSGTIIVTGEGSFAHGYVNGGTMSAANIGSSTQGYVGTGAMTASSPGSSVQGYVSSGTMTASGWGSFVQGYVNSGTMTAFGDGSSVQGYVGSGTMIASTIGSIALNESTHAKARAQLAIGTYNSDDPGATASTPTTTHPSGTTTYGTYAFIIGNGTAENSRSNALTVDWGGNVTVGGNITDGSGNILSNKANSSSLSAVATSGSYNDLTNTPDILNLVYPVGSIYMSVNNVSPATFLGGTWTQIKDTFLLSAGDTYTAGDTGGASTVTLTAAQSGVRNHRHAVSNDDGDAYYLTIAQSPDNPVYRRTIKNGTGSSLTNNVYSANTIQRIGATGYTELDATTAHENMPPYMTVYMWKRTA